MNRINDNYTIAGICCNLLKKKTTPKREIKQMQPIALFLQRNKQYLYCMCTKGRALCACGQSTIKFTVDNSYQGIERENGKFVEVWLCACKLSNDKPFCDGSHENLSDDE
jgi:CDGSH-type Zn-finger protein